MATISSGVRRPKAPQGPAAPVWNRRDLLALRGMPGADLRSILGRARDLRDAANDPATRLPDLAGRTVATMFFEDSTRTRTSFTLAARRLSGDVVDVSAAASSVNKGETLIDTARNIEAMGVSAMVVRARQAGAAAMIAEAVGCTVINAGDGRHEHPTQGLLDTLTLAEAHGRLDGFDLAGLTVAIVGDVIASRVARSGIAAMTALGARVVCVGPTAMAPAGLAALGCRVSQDFDGVLPVVDAVMMLRIQFERYGGGSEGGKGDEARRSAGLASIREYRAGYALTRERAGLLKKNAVVMHPGPINRGLEIDDDIADCGRSVILRQVANGVAVRMAALSMCIGAPR